jgi:hypothetical protein
MIMTQQISFVFILCTSESKFSMTSSQKETVSLFLEASKKLTIVVLATSGTLQWQSSSFVSEQGWRTPWAISNGAFV